MDVALAVVAAAILRGAGQLHCFGRTTVAIPVTIVVVSIVITIVAVSIVITIMVSVVAMEMVAIVVPRTVDLSCIHHEICTASVIHPDALLIESPA